MVKNLLANGGDPRDPGSVSGSGRSPGRGKGNPLQHSCLEDPVHRESGGLQSMRSPELDTSSLLSQHHNYHFLS